jgi:hypothetical protein
LCDQIRPDARQLRTCRETGEAKTVAEAIATLGVRYASRSSADIMAAQPGPQTEFLRSPPDIVIYGARRVAESAAPGRW